MSFTPDNIRAVVRCAVVAMLAVVAMRCANPGTPTGGPRDRKPPVMLSSKPEPYATNFNGTMITMVFDENIQLKDADTKFVMSPPPLKQPKLDAHAMTLRVRFDTETELMPATTYTLDFADCLSDLNEGNILQGFTFTFSTGESTDSMMISGNVYNAQTLAPVSGIYVLLHANLEDSAFTTTPPIRIAKTDDYGRFALKNVPAEADYRVYALDDNNRNFMFDQPGETTAWLLGTVTPSWEIRQIPDSLLIDSLPPSDTSQVRYEYFMRDTLVYTPDSLALFSYLEDTYDQYITSDERKERSKITLAFNKPMPKKPRIDFPDQDPDVEHGVVEYSATNDTCTIWLTDTLIYKKDSVVIGVTYYVLDSLKQLVDKTDTLDMWHFEIKSKADDKPQKRRRKEKEKKPEVPTLKLTISQSINSFGTLSISAATPFRTFDWNAIHLSHKVDTIFEPMQYTPVEDTINIRHKAIKAAWLPGETYQLEIDSAAIYDIYGLQCDRKQVSVNVITHDKYGTLYIDVDSVIPNALLQLVSTKDEVVRQNYVPKNGKVAFRYIKPATYMIRLLIDDNRNGKWDTGNYEKHLQPEQLIYYMEQVQVRANWDIKVEFDVGMFTVDKYARKFKVKSKKKKSTGGK